MVTVAGVGSLSGVVVSSSGRFRWRALEGADVVGTVCVLHRPDRRWFVSFDTRRADVLEALLRVLDADLREDLYITVDEADRARRDLCERCGFTIHRREHVLRIPTAPEVTGLSAVVIPPGARLLSAIKVDVDRLRVLDDRLRGDVPGCDGWVNDPEAFREYTFDPSQFDPATYVVAVDAATGCLTGLARVWSNPTLPRLGLIGVTAEYRRRGLARALLAAAFRPLHDRGAMEVVAEADSSNAASVTLLRSIGASRSGGSLVLIRIDGSTDCHGTRLHRSRPGS